jgi:hypothetical protein
MNKILEDYKLDAFGTFENNSIVYPLDMDQRYKGFYDKYKKRTFYQANSIGI